MDYWTKNHPDIPEPDFGDQGIYTFFEITVNGVKIEVRFKNTEALYSFCNAYDKATHVQVSPVENEDQNGSVSQLPASTGPQIQNGGP